MPTTQQCRWVVDLHGRIGYEIQFLYAGELGMASRFVRFEVQGLPTVAPIVPAGTCGVYVLEFEDGFWYVGQSIDIQKRFAQHVHGGKHHAPWRDVVALAFCVCDARELDELERRLILQHVTAGHKLRNQKLNFGGEGPCDFDHWIAPETQKHWVQGGCAPDWETFALASKGSDSSELKLTRSRHGQKRWHEASDSTVAEATFADIAAVVSLIPEAVNLERRYWTLSDYPGTAGGRLATLNVGCLEVLYFPRRYDTAIVRGNEIHTYYTCVNFPASALCSGSKTRESRSALRRVYRLGGEVFQAQYNLCTTDTVILPLGKVSELLESQYLNAVLRRFLLDLMRSGPSTLFRRSHSEAFAKNIYSIIATSKASDGNSNPT
ncbi:GIY-YIG nuclease family protein [Schaalia suimastitidis]|uniref:GIY-YIG nuclease family protein n=1 Tax=Schaalia suimastitidis TaxID=121163 RepID=UPI00040C586A|nr:GIY-YIG nuclease family protein [Schaalia suimastitidis]